MSKRLHWSRSLLRPSGPEREMPGTLSFFLNLASLGSIVEPVVRL